MRKRPALKGSSAARARAGILVVDDHPIVRQGLRRLIDQEKDIRVCGEVASAREARTAIRELRPDAVIVDISLQDGDGIELIKEARAADPKLSILVLSMHDETIYAERTLSAGANGYIMKQASSEEFLRALRRVLQRAIYVSEQVGNRIIQKFASGDTPVAAEPTDRLSTRELQILQMLGRGMSTRQVADALSLAGKTVETHRVRIKRKLNLSTSSQLIQFAVSWRSGREGGAA